MAAVDALSDPPAAAGTRLADATVCRTPTILQLEAVECGAAALAMVLAWHGRYVPLEVLRIECGVSRDGSKAGNILRAARTHGLVARGFRKEPGELSELPLPAILFWNFNHFVVLEGFKDGCACVNDPALGRRSLQSADFDQAFTGVVLTFERGPDFKPGGDKPSVPRSLKQYLEGLTPSLALAVALGLGLVIPGLVIPTLMSRFVDEVLVTRLPGAAEALLAGLAIAALARGLLHWIQAQVLTAAFTRAAMTAARRFFAQALSLPMEFYAQRSPGEIAARVDLNERVAEIVSNDLSALALDFVTASFFLVLMARLEPGLAALAVLAVCAEVAVWRVLSARAAEGSQHVSLQAGKLAGTATGGLANIESIKAAGQENALFLKWLGLQVRYANAAVLAQRSQLTLGQVPSLIRLVTHLAVLGVASLRIIDGSMSVGNLVAFQVLLAGFSAPVHALFAATRDIHTLRGDLARLDDVLHHARAPGVLVDAPAKADGHAIAPRGISFRDVSFGYDRTAPPLIEGFSLEVKAGQRVALVGASGSGKSTVARLAAGLYQPSGGEVLFDGRARSAFDRELLARSVAYVDQDVVLFEGTVRDNLTLWDRSVEDDVMLAAAHHAVIEDEIAVRKGGLEAPLQEGARNLSGGQRQRLEIARALARGPSILILDEATSALDPSTEALVEANIRRRGIACLVVAHRLSTVRDADEILVMERGRVVERGRHEDLVALPGGRYAALVSHDTRDG